jgi:YVTN family beta-propeller protein
MSGQLKAFAAVFLAMGATAVSAPAPSAEGFAIVKRIPGPDGNWDYATADAVARRLYIARDYGVMAIDLDTHAVTRQLIAGRDVHGIAAVGPSGIFVSTNGATNTATFFEGKSGRVLGTVPTGAGPDSVLFEPLSRLVVVFNHDSGNATVIEPMTRHVVATIPVGGTLESGAIDAQGRVYVNVASKNHVAVIDVQAHRVTDTLNLKGCEEPSGLAYDPKDQLLIAACFNGIAEFVDPSTHRLLGQIRVGKFPDAVIWDPNRRLAFVPSFAAGSLTIIAVSGKSDIKVVQTLATQAGTRTGALDEKTGKIYLPTSKLNPPAKKGAYPTPVPGTFEVLVVSAGETVAAGGARPVQP